MKQLFAVVILLVAPVMLAGCEAERTAKGGHYPIDGMSRDVSQTQGSSVRGPQSVPPIQPGYANAR